MVPMYLLVAQGVGQHLPNYYIYNKIPMIVIGSANQNKAQVNLFPIFLHIVPFQMMIFILNNFTK